MTQADKEQKDLLLKDLCARLPYKTKIQLTEYSDLTGEKFPNKIKILDYCMLGRVQAYCKDFRKDEIKPYLYPMSSMTEEQTEELIKLINTGQNDNNEFMRTLCRIEFYHKHHIDYRGLIPLGLANDATGLNIY